MASGFSVTQEQRGVSGEVRGRRLAQGNGSLEEQLCARGQGTGSEQSGDLPHDEEGSGTTRQY